MDGTKVSLGMGLDGPLELLMAELNNASGPKVRSMSVQEGRQSTGAKFVRANGG